MVLRAQRIPDTTLASNSSRPIEVSQRVTTFTAADSVKCSFLNNTTTACKQLPSVSINLLINGVVY